MQFNCLPSIPHSRCLANELGLSERSNLEKEAGELGTSIVDGGDFGALEKVALITYKCGSDCMIGNLLVYPFPSSL